VTAEAPAVEAPVAEAPVAEVPVAEAPKPKGRSRAKAPAAVPEMPALAPDPGMAVAETVVADPGAAEAAASDPDEPNKPKRKGWWSLGR